MTILRDRIIKALEADPWQTVRDLSDFLEIPDGAIRYHLYTHPDQTFVSRELYAGQNGRCMMVWALKRSQQTPCLRWRPAGLPASSMKHILMRLKDGKFAPGRYSGVNHFFEQWTGTEYEIVYPEEYADLTDI